MQRTDGRASDELRPVSIEHHFTKNADGSVLITVGDTKVICTAMVEDKVPPFMRSEGRGWISAEYAMLPSSTLTRKNRDRGRGADGRATEIQRLIGRALRSAVDLDKLGERTIWIDCDVIQADGGTRTASITGAFAALRDAVEKLIADGTLEENPLRAQVAAVSVGIDKDSGEPLLDLCYQEDSGAIVDMNVVMTENGDIIEIQGTGEDRPFSKDEMNAMMALAEKGIGELTAIQNQEQCDA